LRTLDISFKKIIFPDYDSFKISKLIKELKENLYILNEENTT
jgi:hypothetical protein